MTDQRYTRDEIQEVMDHIDPAPLSYGEWFRAIAGFRAMGADADMVESWCRRDPARFKPDDIRKRWSGITDTGGVTAGTVIFMARQNGYTGSVGGPYTEPWKRQKLIAEEPKRTVKYLREVPGSFHAFQRETLSLLSPADERKAFLEAMFSSEDYIDVVFNAQYNEKKQKWGPLPDQKEVYTLAEWVGMGILERDDYNHDAGLWVRINPTISEPKGKLKEDGSHGVAVCDADIATFKYALIECDDIPEEDQIEAFRRLNLPIRTLVLSGGKSVHAAVIIDAKDRKEYDERVLKLHDWCRKFGVPVDGANKNPSRMIRLPGVKRGEREQRLIGLNQGPRSWEDFQFYMEGVELGLPEVDAIEDINGDNLPPRMPEIVHNAIREKEVVMISAGSKTGKTMLGIELALAVSSGGTWLSRECETGTVLYINMEVNRADFANRIENTRKAMGIELETVKGKCITWTLRGRNVSMDDLISGIQHLLKRYQFTVIVIDPIYKVIGDLDENSAGDMGKLFSYFDTIAEMSGAAVVFVHHHSKGLQAAKLAMERASGSGTFSRAPDVILDIMELEVPPGLEDVLEFESDPIGLRYEWTFRGYPPKKPETGFYIYPLHVPDDEGILGGARTAKEARASDARRQNAHRTVNWQTVCDKIYEQLANESPGGMVPSEKMIYAIMDKAGTSSEEVIKKRLKASGYKIQRGRPAQGIPSLIVPIEEESREAKAPTENDQDQTTKLPDQSLEQGDLLKSRYST